MNLFPKWKYHQTEPARIVPDAEAEAALGPGWVDHPSKLPPPTPAVEPTDEPAAEDAPARAPAAKPKRSRKKPATSQ